MALSRRDLVTIGVAGGAALAIPFERGALSSSSATRMPTSKMPPRFSLPFQTPPEPGSSGTVSIAVPGRPGVTGRYPSYHISPQLGVHEVMPGRKTPLFISNGHAPGPTIGVNHDDAMIVNQKSMLHQPQVPKGRYMMRCHNLVHEDHDMMMQLSVGDLDRVIDDDPIKGAPSEPNG